MQTIFGSGILWGRQLTDSQGNAISNPTPQKFGVAQEISVDMSWDTKMLYGQNAFALQIGRGKGKVSGKVKAAQINGALLNGIVFGQTLTTASETINFSDTSTGTAIPTTPFQLTGVTTAPSAVQFLIPNTGTYAKDLGVRNAATGQNFQRVAAAPAAGQYSVNEGTGVYTFASADNVSAIKVQLDFQYTTTAITQGNKSTVQNQPMGYAPSWACDILMPFQGKSLIFTFPNCITSKFTLATKLDDFSVPEYDFEAFADATGAVATYSVAEL